MPGKGGACCPLAFPLKKKKRESERERKKTHAGGPSAGVSCGRIAIREFTSRALLPTEAATRAHSLVREIMEHWRRSERELVEQCSAWNPRAVPDDEEEAGDVGAGTFHNEGYHRLREEMGVAENGEEEPRCSGFSTRRLKAVRECMASGGPQNYVARVGQFLTILGICLKTSGTLAKPGRQMEEEAREAHTRDEEENTSLMQTSASSTVQYQMGE